LYIGWMDCICFAAGRIDRLDQRIGRQQTLRYVVYIAATAGSYIARTGDFAICLV